MELAGETLEILLNNPITNTAEAFSSPLKLPAAGRQNSALSSKDDGSTFSFTKLVVISISITVINASGYLFCSEISIKTNSV
jgi:hypothetical protein